MAYQIIQRDPELRMREGHHYDLTRAEDREQTMRQIARTIELKKQIKDPRLRQALFMAMAFYSESFSMRIYVHDMLFKQALMLFGSSEQQDKWMDDIENWRVIGCFAMVRSVDQWFVNGSSSFLTYFTFCAVKCGLFTLVQTWNSCTHAHTQS